MCLYSDGIKPSVLCKVDTRFLPHSPLFFWKGRPKPVGSGRQMRRCHRCLHLRTLVPIWICHRMQIWPSPLLPSPTLESRFIVIGWGAGILIWLWQANPVFPTKTRKPCRDFMHVSSVNYEGKNSRTWRFRLSITSFLFIYSHIWNCVGSKSYSTVSKHEANYST